MRWLTLWLSTLPIGGLRRESIKKASSTLGGRGPYFLYPAGKYPLPWGGLRRAVVPSFHDCAPWGMAGLPAWFPCSGLPVSSGARWSKVKNLTAAGPLPFCTGFPFQAGFPATNAANTLGAGCRPVNGSAFYPYKAGLTARQAGATV